MGSSTEPVRHVLGSSGGFTLVEVLVSVGILTVVVSMFGAGLFQVFSIQRFWTDDIITTRTVRHAGSWLAGDALNADEVLDANGDPLTCAPSPPVTQVTLTWAAGTHNVVYSVSGDAMLRDFDDNRSPLTMTGGVVADSLSFTLCENTLRATMDVLADRGATERLDLMTYVRKLP